MNKKIEKQINLLQQQGFEILDQEKVLGYLEKVGYHKLFPYFKDAQKDIDRVIELYIFDKRLRLLTLDMLEVIENALKSVLINYVGNQFNEQDRYLNKDLYSPQSVDERLEFIHTKMTERKESDTRVKTYFGNNKNKTTIPDYLFFDKLTFGETIRIVTDLASHHKKIIANYFQIPFTLFGTWIKNFKYLRNICSHYENLFNRNMTFSIRSHIINESLGSTNSFVSYFALLSLFNRILIPNFDRSKKIIDLMKHFSVSLEQIGQKRNPPSELEAEAWEVLTNSLYEKYIKKSN